MGTLLDSVVIYPHWHLLLFLPPLHELIALYARIVVHYPNSANSQDLVIDSGASHHVTVYFAALALYELYTASDSVIIGDGTSLSISNVGSLTLPSLPTPLLFTNVLHVPAMFKNLILVSTLCADNPVNVPVFYSFFQM